MSTTALPKLKTLVAMQLQDKIDTSFTKSKRGWIFKIVFAVVKPVVVTALFWFVFYLCNMLSVFSFSGVLPDTLISTLFTVVQLMSVITCTVGLTRALYLTSDNKVLLTLPVSPESIFFSKLILYYIFEVKKNALLTLPMFVAYGIVNGAIWYYYPWVLVCFVLVSLLPVAIGAVLSIPALYAATFVKNFKWLQAVLATIAIAAVTVFLFWLVNQLPQNIDLIGQWGNISAAINGFLDDFAKNWFVPYYYVTLMMVGGSARISATLFGGDTFVILAAFLATMAAFLVVAYFVARPLFVSMASKQFEFGTSATKPCANQKHTVAASAFSESAKMSFRSSRFVLELVVQLVLPALLVFFQSKLYAAMNTSYSGAIMTRCFSVLVLAVTTLSFNNQYASVYSREGNARNILKTRPIKPVYTLLSRVYIRAIASTLSVIMASVAYAMQSQIGFAAAALIAVAVSALSLAHLLWSAEMDLMNSQADQYDTVGLEFDNPNERKASIVGFICSLLLVGLLYLFTDGGLTVSLVKCALVCFAFLGARIYLFLTRAKLYFVEK